VRNTPNTGVIRVHPGVMIFSRDNFPCPGVTYFFSMTLRISPFRPGVAMWIVRDVSYSYAGDIRILSSWAMEYPGTNRPGCDEFSLAFKKKINFNPGVMIIYYFFLAREMILRWSREIGLSCRTGVVVR